MAPLLKKRLPLLIVLLALSGASIADVDYYHPSPSTLTTHKPNHVSHQDTKEHPIDSYARAQYEKELRAGNNKVLVPLGLTYLPSGESKKLYSQTRQALQNSKAKDTLMPYLVMRMVAQDGVEIPSSALKQAKPWFERACGEAVDQGCAFYRDVSHQ